MKARRYCIAKLSSGIQRVLQDAAMKCLQEAEFEELRSRWLGDERREAYSAASERRGVAMNMKI